VHEKPPFTVGKRGFSSSRDKHALESRSKRKRAEKNSLRRSCWGGEKDRGKKTSLKRIKLDSGGGRARRPYKPRIKPATYAAYAEKRKERERFQIDRTRKNTRAKEGEIYSDREKKAFAPN